MAKMTVEFEWDDDHGPFWFNLDNLKLLLFSDMKAAPKLIKTKEIDHSDRPYQRYIIE